MAEALFLEGRKGEDARQAVGQVGFSGVLQVLPHDFRVTDHQAALDQDEMQRVKTRMSDPIAQAVFTGEPLPVENAQEGEDLAFQLRGEGVVRINSKVDHIVA